MMNSWRILVVEDEIDGGEVMADILDYYGITTDVVTTGEAALELLKRHQYHAAIIDLALPGMDGMTLVQAIRKIETHATLPCIAHTAYHNSKVRQDAMRTGFNAYMDKPIGQEDLIRTIKSVVEATQPGSSSSVETQESQAVADESQPPDVPKSDSSNKPPADEQASSPPTPPAL